MPPRLNRQVAAQRLTGPGSPDALRSAPERVLLVGAGNFLRGFCGWMVHEMNRRGLFTGRIVVSKSLPDDQPADMLAEQDGLYTVVLRGLAGGEWVESHDLITAVSRGLDPFRDWRGFLELTARPELRFVISNTTEAGIVYAPSPPSQNCPVSFPARMTAMLYNRFLRLGGVAGSGLVFLPCELIERNAEALRKVVLQHAADWLLGEDFRRWIEHECRFLNTLVDRITPGFPASEAAALFERLGYEDRLLVAAEVFHSWVIQADAPVMAELPLREAGLNVVWTDDVERYRTRKVRILNGAHTMLTPAGLLAGLETVRECVEDPLLARYLERGLYEEIVPALDLPAGETRPFAREVLERFRNPAVHHRLAAIALNSTSKWKVRVLPSLQAYVQRRSALPAALTFSLAALIALYRDAPRHGVLDTPEAIELLQRAWGLYDQTGDFGAVCGAVLGQRALWGEDLNEVRGLTDHVAGALSGIARRGMRSALELI